MPLCNKLIKKRRLVGTTCDCKKTGCGCDSDSEMKYLFTFIFSFLRSDDEAKRSVEFRHLTRNASRTQRKVWNGVS